MKEIPTYIAKNYGMGRVMSEKTFEAHGEADAIETAQRLLPGKYAGAGTQGGASKTTVIGISRVKGK